MNKKKAYGFLGIIAIVFLTFIIMFSISAGSLTLPYISEPTGKEYDCSITLEAYSNILSKGEIKSATCSYTGNTCYVNSLGIQSLFTPDYKWVITDGVANYQMEIEQGLTTQATYEMNNKCFSINSDSVTMKLYDNDGEVEDSQEVSL
jgi:hypothetical protein